MLTINTDHPTPNEYHDALYKKEDGPVSIDVLANDPDTIWVTHGDGRPHQLTDAEALSLIEMLRAGRRMLRERGDSQ